MFIVGALPIAVPHLVEEVPLHSLEGNQYPHGLDGPPRPNTSRLEGLDYELDAVCSLDSSISWTPAEDEVSCLAACTEAADCHAAVFIRRAPPTPPPCMCGDVRICDVAMFDHIELGCHLLSECGSASNPLVPAIGVTTLFRTLTALVPPEALPINVKWRPGRVALGTL